MKTKIRYYINQNRAFQTAVKLLTYDYFVAGYHLWPPAYVEIIMQIYKLTLIYGQWSFTATYLHRNWEDIKQEAQC